MKLLPEYSENIVVAVVFRGRWTWFVTEKEDWFLDYPKWGERFRDAGLQVPEQGSERYGIRVLNETTIAEYVRRASEHVATVAELSELFREYVPNCEESLDEMLPSLLVDFDARRLVNSFPEPSGTFEDYVPPGWSGTFDSFVDEVPEEQKYWIVDGRDYSPPPSTPTTMRAARILQWLVAAEVAGLVVAVSGAFVNLKGNRPLADWFSAAALTAIGAVFITAPILSAVRYGWAESAFVGRITKRSHPIRYWVPISLVIAMGFGAVVMGVSFLIRR